MYRRAPRHLQAQGTPDANAPRSRLVTTLQSVTGTVNSSDPLACNYVASTVAALQVAIVVVAWPSLAAGYCRDVLARGGFAAQNLQLPEWLPEYNLHAQHGSQEHHLPGNPKLRQWRTTAVSFGHSRQENAVARRSEILGQSGIYLAYCSVPK